MNNYFKYLPDNPEYLAWGIYITVAGAARVEPRSAYPPSKHPSGYHFNWNNGRILHEYQINYITEGEGLIETKEGQYNIKEGSIILIHPAMWHRYKPDEKTGWTEHYVGFSGELAKKMIGSYAPFTKTPVIQIGFQEDIVQLFNKIVDFVRDEKPGFQQICSGIIIQILGQIIASKRNENFRFGPLEKAIKKACIIIHDSPNENLNIEDLAGQLNINYSIFRKAFKKYTGLSPLQYHTSLRIKEAINLLTNTEMSVKEISYELGFCSVFYFSKLFKEKTNQTPSQYRNSIDRAL